MNYSNTSTDLDEFKTFSENQEEMYKYGDGYGSPFYGEGGGYGCGARQRWYGKGYGSGYGFGSGFENGDGYL
jgi:hypothetical protein